MIRQQTGRTLLIESFGGLHLPVKVIKALNLLWGNHSEPLTKELIVKHFTAKQLMNLPSLGKRSIYILESELNKHGLHFPGTEELWEGARALAQEASFAVYGWLQVTPPKHAMKKWMYETQET